MTDHPTPGSPLAPCPFCGGAASIERFGNTRVSTIYQCDDCGCHLETGEEFNHGRSWNRRAALPVSLKDGQGSFAGAHTHRKDGEFSGRYLLWMLHLRGPDDIYPAMNYETAVEWADRANAIGPEIKAVPALWTGTPESHAEGLAAAIAGWELPSGSDAEGTQPGTGEVNQTSSEMDPS